MIKRLLLLPAWALLALVVAAFLLLGLFFSPVNPWNPLNYFGAPATSVDTSRPAILKQIQSLDKLETASYTMDKIISAGTDGNVFQEFIYGDHILLVAHGTAVAGVDLSNMTENDVKVDNSNLTINTPAPEIFSVSLDDSQTKVYDRSTGLFSKGNKDLESQARASAVSELRKAACSGGILNQAKTQAASRLKQMYKLAGFTSITVNVPEGKC